MLSNIVYAYISKGAMLDRFHITLLLNNELLSNLLIITKNEFETHLSDRNQFKSFKNSMIEILPHRMLILINHM